MSEPCKHAKAIDLYGSHGGFAEWCPECGAARSSNYVDEDAPDGSEDRWPWMPVGYSDE